MSQNENESIKKLKEELYPIITSKLESGELDRFVRRNVVENGVKRTEKVVLTDPVEYLEYLIEKKKMIKGINMYSPEYYINSVKKEDLRVSIEEKKAPSEIPDVTVKTLRDGMTGISIKVCVVDFEVTPIQKRKGGMTSILKIIGSDGEGNCEISSIWMEESIEYIFRMAEENRLIGETIQFSDVCTKHDEYSSFPFVIAPQRSSTIRIVQDEDEKIKGKVDLVEIEQIGENTPVASFVGKIHKLNEEKPHSYTNKNGEKAIFKSQDCTIIGINGGTINLKVSGKACGTIPPEGSQVMIKFAKIIKDAWRVEHGYQNPFVAQIFNPTRISLYEDNARLSRYPQTAEFSGKDCDLYNSDLGRIQFTGSISGLTWGKRDFVAKKTVLQKPYYLSCGVEGCRKKVSGENGNYSCPSGHIPTESTIKKRFLCNAIICDFTNEFKTLISGDVVTSIFGRSEDDMVAEADSMDTEAFFDFVNDQLSINGDFFKIKGSLDVDDFGTKFNINSVEKITLEDAVSEELAKITS